MSVEAVPINEAGVKKGDKLKAGGSGKGAFLLSKTATCIVLGVAVILCLGWWQNWRMASKDFGPIGDSFGMANSIFSGLAFLGLLYAVMLQRAELAEVKAERQAVVEQFEEQERQAAKRHTAQIDQYKDQMGIALKKDQRDKFENRYFKLFEVLRHERELAKYSSADRGNDSWILANTAIDKTGKGEYLNVGNELLSCAGRTLRNLEIITGIISKYKIGKTKEEILEEIDLYEQLLKFQLAQHEGDVLRYISNKKQFPNAVEFLEKYYDFREFAHLY